MSEFLDSLKNAADKGEFNSDAAKKILDIAFLAEEKIGSGGQENIERLKGELMKREQESTVNSDDEVKDVSEEPSSKKMSSMVAEANTEYELKMAQFKKIDLINNQLSTLTEIEEMVALSVTDMFDFIKQIEIDFSDDIKKKNPILTELTDTIGEITRKYSNINN